MKFKHKQTDYTKSMLPQNRKQVFFDVLHLHWQKLLLLGLIFLLFFLPFLLTSVVYDLQLVELYHALDGEDPAQLQNAGNTQAALDVIRGAVTILLLVLLAVPFSGIARVIRQYAWEENVHLSTDFAKGIRDNFFQTAAIGALIGIIYTLCLLAYYNAPSFQSPVLSMLALMPIGISLLVILPIFLIALVMIPVYGNRLFATFKNAFFIYIRCLPRVLLGMILCMLIWVPAMLPDFYCHVFGGLAAALLTPISLLAWTLTCYNLFDRHLNPLVCPELIGKGTFS